MASLSVDEIGSKSKRARGVAWESAHKNVYGLRNREKSRAEHMSKKYRERPLSKWNYKNPEDYEGYPF